MLNCFFHLFLGSGGPSRLCIRVCWVAGTTAGVGDLTSTLGGSGTSIASPETSSETSGPLKRFAGRASRTCESEILPASDVKGRLADGVAEPFIFVSRVAPKSKVAETHHCCCPSETAVQKALWIVLRDRLWTTEVQLCCFCPCRVLNHLSASLSENEYAARSSSKWIETH